MILGSAAVATLYSFITAYIVTTRFDEVFGQGWVNSEKHVIVVGLGDVGYRAVVECQELGLPVVAIDSEASPSLRSRLGKLAFITGDGRDPDTLKRAGLDSAIAVLVCTGDDTVNLSVGLSVRKLNAQARTVVRLFDGFFARKVSDALNLDVTLSASRIAAPGFVGAALFPDVLLSYVKQNHLVIVRPPEKGSSNFNVVNLPLDAAVSQI
jgi:Trk K+ transport system NAD-binding subunit